VVVLGATYAIYRERRDFADALADIGLGATAISFALGLIASAAAYPAWREVMRGLGLDLPVGSGARIFFTTQLGKYLPGSVWPLVLQMEAGRRHGASRRTVIAGNLTTILVGCLVGLGVAVVFLAGSGSQALDGYPWLLAVVPFLVALLHPRAISAILDHVFGLLGRERLGQRVPLRSMATVASWSVAVYLGLGAHVAALVVPQAGGDLRTVAVSVGGMALAVAAGILFIPAPAGAGVRDAVLGAVLLSVLTIGQTLAVLVVSRVLLIVADLLLAGLARSLPSRGQG
jgi:hypothetical protein